MKCLIVSGGNVPSKELILKHKKRDLIIGADKGASSLIGCGIIPHVLIGDFDSLSYDKVEMLQDKGCKIIKYKSEKDFTDTEASLNYAINALCDDVVILGAAGTRLDHTLANINLLGIPFEKGVKCVIEDENNLMFLSKSPVHLKKDNKKYFSIFSYSEETIGLNITGAKYELKNHTINKNSTLTISNEFISDTVKIDFDLGIILIILSND